MRQCKVAGCREPRVGYALAEHGELDRNGFPNPVENRCLAHALERTTAAVLDASHYLNQLYRLSDLLGGAA